jgi:hypothetical protein
MDRPANLRDAGGLPQQADGFLTVDDIEQQADVHAGFIQAQAFDDDIAAVQMDVVHARR